MIDIQIAKKVENDQALALKANKAMGEAFTLTLINGWTGTLSYRKNDLGQVHILATLGTGTVTNRTTVATLPVGYRPQYLVTVIANKSNVFPWDAMIGFIFNPDGTVLIMSPLAENLTANNASAGITINATFQI